MGARKPNDSQSYKSQALDKRGNTLIKGTWNLGKDCGTIAAIAFFHPNKGYKGAVVDQPGMPEPDWNTVIQDIRRRQVVENGELVRPTARGRKKASASSEATASNSKVQKNTTAVVPPRKRGRPRKNPVVDSRVSPPGHDTVAEVITVADDRPCSPSGLVHRQDIPQDSAQADADAAPQLHQGLAPETGARKWSAASHSPMAPAQAADSPSSSVSKVTSETSGVSVEAELSQEHGARPHADGASPGVQDEQYGWFDASQAWDDHDSFHILGFGGAPLQFDAFDGGNVNSAELPDTITTIQPATDPGVSSLSSSPRDTIDCASQTTSPAAGRSRAVNEAESARPKQPNLLEVLNMWQQTINEFTAR
ncbi:hypothetical protein FHETE_11416, partial [Fusarium heterosporum]